MPIKHNFASRALVERPRDGECREMLRLKDLRRDHPDRLTLEQLSERTGIDVSLLSRYERGVRWPPAERLRIIADALGVRVFELFDEYEGPPQKTRDLLLAAERLSDEQIAALLAVISSMQPEGD